MPESLSSEPIELREARLDKRRLELVEWAETVLDRIENVPGLPPLGKEPRPALTLAVRRETTNV